MLVSSSRARGVALTFILSLAGAAGLAGTAYAGDKPLPAKPIVGAALPGVTLPPVETTPAPQPGNQAADDERPVASSPVVAVPDRATLFLTPGENQVIPISKGHLNRIITPFAHPTVRTVSTAKISTHDAVLYVASTDAAPVTLYVSPRGRQDMALSITLLPKPIPPREVHLQIKGQQGQVYFSPPRAGEWERSRPYVETIKKVLRELALGKVPPGYGMQKWKAGDPPVVCTEPGLKVKPGQVLPGSSLILVVATAKNVSQQRIEIQEGSCRYKGVLAVAAWPHASLAPGSRTELYVVVRRPSQADEARARPSLLDAESPSDANSEKGVSRAQ